MKKTTLLVLAFGAFLASCSDNGKQVESSEAKEVETVQTETSVEYATIKEGSYIDWRASHLGGAEPRFGKMYLQSANIVTNKQENCPRIDSSLRGDVASEQSSERPRNLIRPDKL